MRLQARRNITGSYNRNRGRVKADNDSLSQNLSRPLLRCAAEESSVESESDGYKFLVIINGCHFVVCFETLYLFILYSVFFISFFTSWKELYVVGVC